MEESKENPAKEGPQRPPLFDVEMSQYLKRLATPFDPKEIDWRIGQAGSRDNKPWAKVLAYIDARAVMDRLDDVVGPGNWKDRYWREGAGVMCGLAIRINGEWVEKVDGSDETDIEAFKGGISKAMVRTAVKWGIGRYLYNLGDGWAQIVTQGTPGARWQGAKTDGKPNQNYPAFHWLPPELPKWAVPEGVTSAGKPSGGSEAHSARAAATATAVKGRLANDGPKQATGRDQGQAGQPQGGGRDSVQGPSVEAGIDRFFDDALQEKEGQEKEGAESVRGVRGPGGRTSVPQPVKAADAGRSGSGNAQAVPGGRASGVPGPVGANASAAVPAPQTVRPAQGSQDAGRAVAGSAGSGRSDPAGIPRGADQPNPQQNDGGSEAVLQIATALDGATTKKFLEFLWKKEQPRIKALSAESRAYLETVKDRQKEKLKE